MSHGSKDGVNGVGSLSDFLRSHTHHRFENHICSAVPSVGNSHLL